ncbi:hypothetical protein HA075_14500 [bacterium BFN5]|nr:hypothetical protein HA075_14480 [bacterium BFN5]QJW46923.1 hypothetical protein HA075_14500 [bacterium BFN5]
MSRAKGYNSQLVLGYENEYGTTPAVSTGYNMPFNQSKIGVKQNLIESATIRGRRDREEPVVGNIDVAGNIVIPIDQVGIGFWLTAMFGSPTTTGSGNPYTHVFKVKDSQPSLVLEQQYPDIATYEMFNGCKVNKFAFTYGGDTELTAQVDLIGAKRTIGAAAFTSDLTDVSLLRFSNFQGRVEEAGSPLAIVTEATLNLDFGLDGNNYAIGGGGYRTELPEGYLQVSGTIKAFFENATLLNKAVQNTKTSLNFKFVNGAHSLGFFMEEVVLEQTSPGIENEKGIFINLPFKAFYHNGIGGSAVVATLVNSQESYTRI